MNTATQNLENDHVHILRLTDIMLAMVEQKCTETDHFELAVNLIRKFADGLHHAKEEELLFPLLGEKGFSPEHGPVAVMLMEHVQGRNFVKGITDGIVALKKGKSGAIQLVYENLSGYATLLENHISKENNILFRMADQMFSADEQQTLIDQFAVVESGADPEFNAENSIAKIDFLASIYMQ
jgi:hemerythrin-like domain-containing protein